jgi:hypothetical protein
MLPSVVPPEARQKVTHRILTMAQGVLDLGAIIEK